MNAGRENEDARSVLQTLKMIEYHYSAPAREVVTRLRLFPRAIRGPQRLLQRECEGWRSNGWRRWASGCTGPCASAPGRLEWTLPPVRRSPVGLASARTTRTSC